MWHCKQEGSNSPLRSSLVSHAAAALTHDSERRAKWTFIPTVSSNQLARSLSQLPHPTPNPPTLQPPCPAFVVVVFFFAAHSISNYPSFWRNVQPTIFVPGNMYDESGGKAAY